MKFMLDTNICIYVIKQRPQSVLERFASHPVGDLGISVITLAELEYGASESKQPRKKSGSLGALHFSVRSSCVWAVGHTDLWEDEGTVGKKGGRSAPWNMLIAAHALSLKVKLVTNNVREFKRIPGLRVENWV